ncbi:unnamed protein product [Eretmochelys imbricata]
MGGRTQTLSPALAALRQQGMAHQRRCSPARERDKGALNHLYALGFLYCSGSQYTTQHKLGQPEDALIYGSLLRAAYGLFHSLEQLRISVPVCTVENLLSHL